MARAAPDRFVGPDRASLVPRRIAGHPNPGNHDPWDGPERFAQEAQLPPGGDDAAQTRVHGRARQPFRLETDVRHAASQHRLELGGVMGRQHRDADERQVGTSRARRRLQHRPAAEAVHRRHADAQLPRRRDGRDHGVRDVVPLEVEEDPDAPGGELARHRRAFARVDHVPELSPREVREPGRKRERLPAAGHIEGDDQLSHAALRTPAGARCARGHVGRRAPPSRWRRVRPPQRDTRARPRWCARPRRR